MAQRFARWDRLRKAQWRGRSRPNPAAGTGSPEGQNGLKGFLRRRGDFCAKAVNIRAAEFAGHCFVRSTANLPSGNRKPRLGYQLQVLVRENNVDQALRVLKKKMQREGIFREMKARQAYEKPSEKRAREKAEAIRRTRKAARKQMQREGLLPAPKKKIIERAPRPGA
jgi:small subunit ribosomal protein S21